MKINTAELAMCLLNAHINNPDVVITLEHDIDTDYSIRIDDPDICFKYCEEMVLVANAVKANCLIHLSIDNKMYGFIY